ncbi:bifunctional N(6)-L-threonylcarbamoyladenine synthase/serine/threonine protein kinase [Acidiplasma sp.]|uniref:bifunctional N(6)-L-threonylcarbamoyladenine synthase/serine/threonine protein kinase n=1 Tax=Acidiplasma sp. TaxID=1872114 RepID=UPI00258717C1|nr:bifunctional N(6)-L-threonylcarbamoyladenine synthase/serine/threonine protein kinase [Acidiplasma sp.]
MIVLGIEGTAHTISAGIVDDSRILANASSTYIPDHGGIHPREAAIHHADKIMDVMHKAFEEAKIGPDKVDLVSFSQGPGLGPCLRIAAVAARSFSLKYNIPILGVNHPLGHVEIGRKLSGAIDPIMLYISGGNTQIIAHEAGRYRVLGETMDIGLGNLLDKFARDSGIPFPGGPVIERLALKGRKLLDLPYSVKGMDTSFSGIYTASKRYLETGERLEDICFSIQETSFAMVIEVLERALYYTSKNEILLAGGVARNDRLRSMILEMAESSGYKAYLTDKKYCMDNGAMIAQAGLLMYKNGARQQIMETRVNQRFRIDEVEVPWIKSVKIEACVNRGAESKITRKDFYGRDVIMKERLIKSYRNKKLDKKIRNERTRNEFMILYKLQSAGIKSPMVYDYDKYQNILTIQYIPGITLNQALNNNHDKEFYLDLMDKLGNTIALMHNNKISHGDLNPNNIIINGTQIYLIDPSMGKYLAKEEDLADDIFLFTESLKNLYENGKTLEKLFIDSYKKYYKNPEDVLALVKEIADRRRYV